MLKNQDAKNKIILKTGHNKRSYANGGGTMCPEESTAPVGISHTSQMFYGNHI